MKPVKICCLNVTNVKWDCQGRTPMEPSPPPSVKGMHVTNMIMMRHNNAASWRYGVGFILKHGFRAWEMAWDEPNQHAYWMQPKFLTHVAHLLKLQDIQTSSQTSRIIDQILLNLASKNGLEMAYFRSFIDQFIVKSRRSFAPNSAKLVEMQSRCVTDNTSPWFNKWATFIRICQQLQFSCWRCSIEP